RGAPYLLMVIEPAIAQLPDGNRLKAVHDGDAELQPVVDLAGKLVGRLAVGTDAWLSATTLFVVAQIPDAATKVAVDTSHLKTSLMARWGIRSGRSHGNDPQRSVPLQSATKSATNGHAQDHPSNATARQSRVYDWRAVNEAERMGFEPMVGCDTHTDLANRRF